MHKGDLPAAKSRIRDLETAGDKAEEQLKPLDFEKWNFADKSIDKALRALRSGQPEAGACRTSLEALLATVHAIDHKQ